MNKPKFPTLPEWESNWRTQYDGNGWWDEWVKGVEWAYKTKDDLEARLEEGETLSEEELANLEVCRKTVVHYRKNGLKRN